ncbi:MAG: hypothetical protein K9N06_04920 [Candidatus Cloacimonetes bacterium]|nr:hypothetical protein [Candidatus Cloacimonadota bacterium]
MDNKKSDKKPEPPQKVFKGLCTNCENRFICKLPRPETGVWYCEEYE